MIVHKKHWSGKIPTYISVYNGICHYLGEKNIFSFVHPIWTVFVYYMSSYITGNYGERILLTTLHLYKVLFEMLNSSIEQTNDRMGMEFNIHTKRAKELSAAVTTLSGIPMLLTLLYMVQK